ncbi:substrate-binding domain-containing protein [Streptomyces sp. NPDC101151]|uniref:substrate-binding domain-containing protein n=1 Tax=Streptomyces sp. NPDC101151 TaxID=3366115 RepID=UPI0037F6C04E
MSRLRHAGHRQVLEAAGPPVDPPLAQSVPTPTMDAAARRARAMVTGGLHLDGAFCVTDTVATGAPRGPADAGVRVPGQVEVTGSDNAGESAFLVPSLSTVDPDHEQMAAEVVALSAARIGRARPPVDREEFVSRFLLVIRDSTGG